MSKPYRYGDTPPGESEPKRLGKWWWIKPGHEAHRCTAQRKDPYFSGQCKGLAIAKGLCRYHAKEAGVACYCPKCGARFEVRP
jgi:hypothetical protein